jgi:DNA polymerase III gamma/tau subunit
MSDFTRVKELLYSGRMPHAVILEGKGAENLADYIAQCSVCSSDNPPCGQCPHCTRAKSGNHPDIIHITGTGITGAISIAQVRELKVSAYVMPSEAKKKVYILHNAEKMLIPAQNALLKLLEEPPQSVLILLLCEEKKGLLETVLSRAALIPASGDDEFSDSEQMRIAKKIAFAVLQSDELVVLKETAPLIGDRKQFSAVLENLSDFYREVYKAKLADSENEEAKRIADKITLEMALNLSGAVDEIRLATVRNANQKLNITRLCAKLRKAVSK